MLDTVQQRQVARPGIEIGTQLCLGLQDRQVVLGVKHSGAGHSLVGLVQHHRVALGLKCLDLAGQRYKGLTPVGLGRIPESSAQVAGNHHGKHAADQATAIGGHAAEQNRAIFGREDRRRRGQGHQIHDAFARGEGQQGKLRHQPQAEKQQVPIARQAFAKVPQAQVHQDIPRQKGLGQFGQVVVDRLVMPGFDEGAAETSDAVGPQHLTDRLHPTPLIQKPQPDKQRHQRQ